MNPGPTSERIYEEVRTLVIGRSLQPGARLDPATIADALSASTTPVREALNRLAGEDLVATRSGGGFHLAQIDEPALKDLYGWSGDICAAALRHAQADILGTACSALVSEQASDYARRAANVFVAVVSASRNSEHHAAIRRVNDRLHPLRIGEPATLVECESELGILIRTGAEGDLASMRTLLLRYHRRRLRAASELLRRRYRDLHD
jgi:DNA-binding GntR family transcriptional regulator